MATVTKRELNQRTAEVLALVSDAEDVVVTERGVPRWRVVSVQGDWSVLDKLAREGRYHPPTDVPPPWPDHVGGPAYTDEQATAVLDEVRGDH